MNAGQTKYRFRSWPLGRWPVFGKLITLSLAEGHEVIRVAASVPPTILKGDVATVVRYVGAAQPPGDPRRPPSAAASSPLAGPTTRRRPRLHRRARARTPTRPPETLQAEFPTTDIFSHIAVADGRVWMLPGGVECFAGDLPETRAEARVGDPRRARRGPVRSERRRRRLAGQAQLVHRGRQGPHRPSRTPALRRQAHARHHL